MTGEVKARLIEVLVQITERHQAARAQVTEATVTAFMTPRPLIF